MMLAKKYILLVLMIVLVMSNSMASGGRVSDMSQIGMGARVLGMGKAFVGVADDCNSLFRNPAGLGKVGSLELMSMQASLMGDVNYLVLGGAVPFGAGTIGIGYIGSNVDGISRVAAMAVGDRPVAIDSITYSEKEIHVGYGMDLVPSIGRWIGLEGALYVGADLKMFIKDAAGISDGQGSGAGLDIGLLYAPTDAMNLGLPLKNMNSQISWASGATDYVEQLAIAGLKVDMGGMTLGLDAEMAGGNKPVLLHSGLEWTILPTLTIRTGVDQSLLPPVAGSSGNGSTKSNMTVGLGLDLGKVTFDYAYHPYYEEEDNTTHFISLSYHQ